MLYIVSILCMCPSQSPNSSPYSPFPLVAVHPFEGHYSVAQLCPTLCNLIDCSTPGFPVLHHLPELVQTHVSWVGDAIQPFEGRIKFYCFMANSVLHLSFPGTGTQEIQLTPGLSSSQDWDVCSRNWLEHILSHGVAEGENLQWWVSRKVWGLACRRVPMMRWDHIITGLISAHGGGGDHTSGSESSTLTSRALAREEELSFVLVSCLIILFSHKGMI